jgi:hypothetical protein
MHCGFHLLVTFTYFISVLMNRLNSGGLEALQRVSIREFK